VKVTGRCRKCDKVGEIIEHSIARCSSLYESAYLGRHNQLAKNNSPRDRPAILYSLEILSYFRYNSEPVLELSNMILHWDRTVITEKMVDFNSVDQQGE
jgi:hypothetical protein